MIIEIMPTIINIIEIIRTTNIVFFIPIVSRVFPKGNIKNVRPNIRVKILDIIIYSENKIICMIIVYKHIATMNPKIYLYFFQ